MRKIIAASIVFCLCVFSFAQDGSSLIEKYVKGNISDKTSAVREASGNDAVWLSTNAISFVLQSKQILKNDRDLDGLAVAAVLSFPADYIKTTSSQNRELILDNFMGLFLSFGGSTTVQTAVLNKTLACKQSFSLSAFSSMINSYLVENDAGALDPGLVKSMILFLEETGNSESFNVIYNLRADNVLPAFKNELDEALLILLGNSLNEAISIIKQCEFQQATDLCSMFFAKKDKISKNSLCNIAENLISKSIIYMENAGSLSKENEKVLDEAVGILNEFKWTRCADLLVSYFSNVKVLYENGMYSEECYIRLIRSLNTVSSVKAVSPLIETLFQMNSRAETPGSVPGEVALAVVQTLGAIGDKSAFDVLLATTYYNYPEKVLSAAQLALAELKW